MEKVYVLTWDNEHPGLLFNNKVYPTRERAEQVIKEYINAVHGDYQEAIKQGTFPQIHELEICF